ncbi:hypothetical protein CIG75_00380 [Tumebacillus algifaecis]|uniref:Uncharacterized protein n=1 Tax=Tumebacillus algifaecis TaxID=1214604 RepID=A0A223CWA7_9BACL|nr:HBL/NHE enterotoxin family protein [Tumebacillus algifaecis]ASS73580.1 hypothetical protein CIG75_00380 [Tumebacillus algifaecis]
MTQSIDLSCYQWSLSQPIHYEHTVIDFTLQSLYDKPSWYDDFSNSTSNFKTNAMSWSNQVVPHLIAVPQEAVSYNPPVKARFDSLIDDLNDLTKYPEDGDSLQDASNQIKGIEQIQIKLIGDIATLIGKLSNYESILPHDESQQQMYVNASQAQIASNQASINNLQTEIERLNKEIKKLNKVVYPTQSMIVAQQSIQKDKAKIQSDQQQINNYQQDNNTLQSWINSLVIMMHDNSTARSGSEHVMYIWNQLNDLLREINDALEQTQSNLSQNQALATTQAQQAQALWNEFEGVCEQLLGYQYG